MASIALDYSFTDTQNDVKYEVVLVHTKIGFYAPSVILDAVGLQPQQAPLITILQVYSEIDVFESANLL